MAQMNAVFVDRSPAIDLDDWTLWDLARALADGDGDALGGVYGSFGFGVETLVWDLAADACRAPEIRFLLGWWNGKRGDRPAPSPAEIRPEELRPALGWLALLDVLEGGQDLRYRLHGSLIGRYMGKDLTGMRLAQVPSPLGETFMVEHRAVIQRCEPLYLRGRLGHPGHPGRWDRLILPFAVEGVVTRTMVCAVYAANGMGVGPDRSLLSGARALS